jgi:hypothetical protein
MKKRKPFIVVDEASRARANTNDNPRRRRLVVDSARDAHVMGELQEAKRAEDPSKLNPAVKKWSVTIAEYESTIRESATSRKGKVTSWWLEWRRHQRKSRMKKIRTH